MMDPDGQFVDAFGQQATAAEIESKIDGAIEEWRMDHGRREE